MGWEVIQLPGMLFLVRTKVIRKTVFAIFGLWLNGTLFTDVIDIRAELLALCEHALLLA